jgi:N-acetylneuraminic acid mutarotase
LAGGEIILAGGTNWKDDTKQWLRRIYAYKASSNSWSETGWLDVPIAYAAAGEFDGALWFAGGSSGTNTHTAVWKIDAKHNPKTVFTLGEGFALAGSAVVGDSLLVLGGTDDMNNLARATNVFRAISLRNGRVTRLADYPEPAFVTGASATVGARFFAFGGARWDAGSNTVANLSSAHSFNTMTKRWEKLTPFPYPVRGLTACSVDGSRIYLAGGYKNDAEEFTDDAFTYDINTGRYTAAPPLPYKAMVHLVKSGEWVYCLGGEDRKKHRSDAVYRIPLRTLLVQ